MQQRPPRVSLYCADCTLAHNVNIYACLYVVLFVNWITFDRIEIGSSDKPSLIIVRNFVNPTMENDSNEDDPYNIEEVHSAFSFL